MLRVSSKHIVEIKTLKLFSACNLFLTYIHTHTLVFKKILQSCQTFKPLSLTDIYIYLKEIYISNMRTTLTQLYIKK